MEKIAQALVAKQKGILAADESQPTIKKRFDTINVESTEENRNGYREMLFTTEGLEQLHQRGHLVRRNTQKQNQRRKVFS